MFLHVAQPSQIFSVFANHDLTLVTANQSMQIILSLFRNRFNKFNNTGGQMLDSII